MADWITELIGEHGYLALFMLMFLENVFPPIPSELIMPFAGYAAAKRRNRSDRCGDSGQRGFVAGCARMVCGGLFARWTTVQ